MKPDNIGLWNHAGTIPPRAERGRSHWWRGDAEAVRFIAVR